MTFPLKLLVAFVAAPLAISSGGAVVASSANFVFLLRPA